MSSKVLYIAGYGRSGSTVLSAILASHDLIVSVGEVGFFYDELTRPSRMCSCGKVYRECEFWAELAQSLEGSSDLAKLCRSRESLLALPSLLWGGKSEIAEAYGRCQECVLDYARESSGKPIVLDSSKSAWLTAARALALHRFAGQDVQVLHLIRDGRSTLRSILSRGENQVIEGNRDRRPWPAVRASVGWTVSNLVASRVGEFLGKKRYLKVRYEDLIENTEDTLRTMGEFTELDLGGVVERHRRGESFDTGHMIGGNRVRFRNAIQVADTPDLPSKRSLRPGQRIVFGLVGNWLNRRYGYAP